MVVGGGLVSALTCEIACVEDLLQGQLWAFGGEGKMKLPWWWVRWVGMWDHSVVWVINEICHGGEVLVINEICHGGDHGVVWMVMGME